MNHKSQTTIFAVLIMAALTGCNGAASTTTNSTGTVPATTGVTISKDGAIVSAGESSAGGAEETETTPDTATNAQDASTLPAPDFTLVDQYGETHTLSDYKGKVVFLNFWATWCPPCRAEMPDIQALYEEQLLKEDAELVILGVAGPHIYGNEGSAEDIAAFLSENGYTYPTVMDTDGSLMRTYGITAFPTTFMITKEGTVAGYLPGSMTRDIMDDIIAQTMGK